MSLTKKQAVLLNIVQGLIIMLLVVGACNSNPVATEAAAVTEGDGETATQSTGETDRTEAEESADPGRVRGETIGTIELPMGGQECYDSDACIAQVLEFVTWGRKGKIEDRDDGNSECEVRVSGLFFRMESELERGDIRTWLRELRGERKVRIEIIEEEWEEACVNIGHIR